MDSIDYKKALQQLLASGGDNTELAIQIGEGIEGYKEIEQEWLAEKLGLVLGQKVLSGFINMVYSVRCYTQVNNEWLEISVEGIGESRSNPMIDKFDSSFILYECTRLEIELIEGAYTPVAYLRFVDNIKTSKKGEIKEVFKGTIKVAGRVLGKYLCSLFETLPQKSDSNIFNNYAFPGYFKDWIK
jgi:hypothetical protein